MTDPTLLLITKEIQSRLENIDGEGDYFTRIGSSVERGRRHWNPAEVPCCSIYLGTRTIADTNVSRASMDQEIVIEALSDVEDLTNPEDTSIKILSDIQRAVETTDRDISHKIIGEIMWVSDVIAYPDNDPSVIGARVTYSIPQIRKYGDPD